MPTAPMDQHDRQLRQFLTFPDNSKRPCPRIQAVALIVKVIAEVERMYNASANAQNRFDQNRLQNQLDNQNRFLALLLACQVWRPNQHRESETS